MASSAAPLHVHWLRHGRVASHQGDVPLTSEGLLEVEEAGERISSLLVPGESIFILHAPTQRTLQTARALYTSLMNINEVPQVQLHEPSMNTAIRNPDIYVAGKRVELVSSADALADQLPSSGLSPEALSRLPFWQGFWNHPDRIGYWVSLVNPPGEDADCVARRLFTFALSLLDVPRQHPQRYICVTHSPTMRAFLRRYLLGHDPGEPEYNETIDMDFSTQNILSITYRDTSKEIALS